MRSEMKGRNDFPAPLAAVETILVVDDNPMVLRTVTAMLLAENFHVLSAGCGPSALQLADKTTEPIDLLLSDVHLPQISGPDLGEALKKARPNLHVMLMSG